MVMLYLTTDEHTQLQFSRKSHIHQSQLASRYHTFYGPDSPIHRRPHTYFLGAGRPALVPAGVPLRTIQKMLGHSDITITARTYADVMSRAAREQVRAAFEQ